MRQNTARSSPKLGRPRQQYTGIGTERTKLAQQEVVRRYKWSFPGLVNSVGRRACRRPSF